MSKDLLGNVDNSRSEAQRAHMKNTVGQGKCPFCDLNTILNVVIKQGKFWRMWKNPFPYSGHQLHFVIAAIEHISNPLDVTSEMIAELGEFEKWAMEKYDLPGGGLVRRFGDNAYNGGTLFHVHAHIQVPDRKTFAIAVFYMDRRLEIFLAGGWIRWLIKKMETKIKSLRKARAT